MTKWYTFENCIVAADASPGRSQYTYANDLVIIPIQDKQLRRLEYLHKLLHTAEFELHDIRFVRVGGDNSYVVRGDGVKQVLEQLDGESPHRTRALWAHASSVTVSSGWLLSCWARDVTVGKSGHVQYHYVSASDSKGRWRYTEALSLSRMRSFCPLSVAIAEGANESNRCL